MTTSYTPRKGSRSKRRSKMRPSRCNTVTFTFDTNCVNAKGKLRALNQLENWHRRGLIEVCSTTSMEEELLQDGDPHWGPRRRQKLASYSGMDTAFWVLGYSRLGISTKLGGDSTQDEMEGLAAILFPKCKWFDLSPSQIRDVMGLHTHCTYKRDAFVTLNTKDFVGKQGGKRERLKKEFGISVFTPEEAVQYVRATLQLAQ